MRDAASERQVIVFSEDRAFVELARKVCGQCAVIELAGPNGWAEAA